MLWRACRGNVFLGLSEIETSMEDPYTVRINCIYNYFIIFIYFYIYNIGFIIFIKLKLIVPVFM